MFGKLVSYELKTSYKSFLLIYGILILIMLVNMGMSWWINELAYVWIGVMAAAAVAAVVLLYAGLLKIFQRNTFGDGGYFTMMLPVSTKKLVAAKLTAAASEAQAQAQAETAVRPEKKRASVLDQVAEKLPATASTITNFKDAVAKHTGRGKKQTEGK